MATTKFFACWMAYRCAILLILLTTPVASQLYQDKSIYGKFEQAVVPLDAKEQAQILAKCFWGMGFTTCVANYQDDDIILQRNTDYYNDITDNYGSSYCLTCCGEHEEKQDTWDLHCDLDISTASSSNVYGYELRLGAMQYDGDQTIISCPLKRTACTYEDDGVTLIECVADNTYLVGYTLTLEVQEYDKNFNFWTGIKSCSLVAEESTTPLASGDTFRETIIMEYPWDIMNTLDFAKPLIALFIIITLTYIVLYTFRRKHCVYCQGKLVWSHELCLRCKFVGAEPIDPILLEALEDKGLHGQGEMPEQFPGSKKAVAYIRKQYGKASKKWNARRLRRIQEMEEADMQEKLAIIEAEKEELRRAQEEANKHDDVLGLSGKEGGIEKKEEEEDEVSRLRSQFDLGLGAGVTVGLDEIVKGEEDYEETYGGGDGDGDGDGDGEEGKEGKSRKNTPEKGGEGASKEVRLVDSAADESNQGIASHSDSAAAGGEGELDSAAGNKDKDKPSPVVTPYKKPWRYPKWMKIFGFRNKPKEIVPVVNPNLLPYPKHVIYAAVGHHRPPPPDAEMEKEKRAIFMEALGYVPGEEIDEDGNVIIAHHNDDDNESKSPYGPKEEKKDKYTVDGVPFWQAELKASRDAVRKAPPEPDWWAEYGLDELLGFDNPFRGLISSKPQNASQLRRAYRKKRNYLCWEDGTFPKFRQAAPFLMLALCIILFLCMCFVLLFAGLDMSRW